MQIKVYPEESEQTGLAAKVDVETEDHGDGCYTCTYTPQQACIHAVRVMLDNKHVKGSPFKVKVLEMPEWGCEEVAELFDQNALQDYTAAVLVSLALSQIPKGRNVQNTGTACVQRLLSCYFLPLNTFALLAGARHPWFYAAGHDS